MPFPQAAVDAQQAIIATAMEVVHQAILTDNAGSTPTTVAAVVAARVAVSNEVGNLALVILQAPHYEPATEAQKFFELAYQISYALVPKF